jgi:hypothetical protein
MTPEQHELIFRLVLGAREPISHRDFLSHFGVQDGRLLGLELLQDAWARKDGDDVEYAMVVCSVFGFSLDHLETLIALAFADWHRKHEDVAFTLEELASRSSVEALVHLATVVPAYLEFEQAHALARKATWGLAKIHDDEAKEALELLARSGRDEVVRGYAARRLQRWDD